MLLRCYHGWHSSWSELCHRGSLLGRSDVAPQTGDSMQSLFCASMATAPLSVVLGDALFKFGEDCARLEQDKAGGLEKLKAVRQSSVH